MAAAAILLCVLILPACLLQYVGAKQTGLAAARLKINQTRVCVVFPVTNFTAAIDTVWNRNMDESVETPDDDVKYVMKTDSKMTEEELESFKSKSQILYEMCQGRPKAPIDIIVDTLTVTDEDVSQLDQVTFLSIYGKVSLYLNPTLLI